MKLVILPGLDGTGEFLSEFVSALGTDYDTVVMRYPSAMFRYEDLQTWVEARLPKDSYALLAESFSGPIAVKIAAQRPAGLRCAVFVATFAKSPRKLPTWLAYAAKVLPIKSSLLVSLSQPLLMGRWATKGFEKHFRETLKQLPSQTIAFRLREVLSVDVAKEVEALSLPFAYFMASNDQLVPHRIALDFKIAGAVVRQVDGPHFLLQANPEEAAKTLDEFVSTLR